MSRWLRYLRIAFSVTCGLTCLFIVVSSSSDIGKFGISALSPYLPSILSCALLAALPWMKEAYRFAGRYDRQLLQVQSGVLQIIQFPFRRPRVLISGICGFACILLVLLWVRSYWWKDHLRFPINSYQVVGGWSVEGTIAVYRATYQPGFFDRLSRFMHHDLVNRDVIDQRPQIRVGNHGPLGFGVVTDRGSFFPYFSYWVPVLVTACMGALPWLPWRFSLRTLLIATTLIAVVLGAIVYAMS